MVPLSVPPGYLIMPEEGKDCSSLNLKQYETATQFKPPPELPFNSHEFSIVLGDSWQPPVCFSMELKSSASYITYHENCDSQDNRTTNSNSGSEYVIMCFRESSSIKNCLKLCAFRNIKNPAGAFVPSSQGYCTSDGVGGMALITNSLVCPSLGGTGSKFCDFHLCRLDKCESFCILLLINWNKSIA